MKSLADRLSFHPQRLPAARQTVVLRHPGFENPLPPVEGEVTADLKRRVEQASEDPAALRRLASELSAPEVRMLAHALVMWPKLEGAIREIIRQRPDRLLTPILWKNLEGLPGNQGSLELLRLILGRKGRHLWPREPWRATVSTWFQNEVLVPAIAGWADGKESAIDALPELPDTPFSQDTALLRSVLGHVLMTADQAGILRQPEGARRAAWGELSPDGKTRAGSHYLRTVETRGWEGWMLKRIEDSFGLPGAEKSRPAFWDAVPEELRKEFRVRRLSKKLEEVFADHERLDYWKSRWIHEIRDITQDRAGVTPYAVLDFGRFGVVEFMQVGNAAYFYYKEDLKEIASRSATTPSGLKSKKYYAVDRGRWRQDNRLIHVRGWQSTADSRMRRWLKLND